MFEEIQNLVLNLNIKIIHKEILKIKHKNPSTFIGKGNYVSHTDGVTGFDSEKNEIKTLEVEFNYV